MDLPKQLAEDNKFLQKCKDLASANKDVTVPVREPDLYPAKMWVIGVITALLAMGYEVKKL